MKDAKKIIVLMVLFACVCMALVDAVIQPGYVIKSAIKITLFLLLPILYAVRYPESDLKSVLLPNKKGFLFAVSVGVLLYVIILAAYLISKTAFDFSALTKTLNTSTGVTRKSFLWVALYISLVNSLLEEFFFRGFAFLTVRRFCSRCFAYLFSASFFALYHVSMMLGWFAWPVLLLTILGLFIGGLIFDYFSEKYGNIFTSYLIHFFANLATNTIGFLLFLH